VRGIGRISLGALVLLAACRRTPVDSAAKSDAPSRAGANATDRRDSVADEIATAQRRTQLTNDACAAHLRARRLARASFPPGEAKLGGSEASAWKRPSTIQCELCGAPIRDGDAIVARIAIVNTGAAPADVFLQSANHGPFWLDTVPPVPPAPPATPSGQPMPEIFPAPMLWSIPAGSALDAEVQADVSPSALRKGGAVRVRASVVFWNGGGFDLCGEANVAL
jgi:hypothetical protein